MAIYVGKLTTFWSPCDFIPDWSPSKKKTDPLESKNACLGLRRQTVFITQIKALLARWLSLPEYAGQQKFQCNDDILVIKDISQFRKVCRSDEIFCIEIIIKPLNPSWEIWLSNIWIIERRAGVPLVVKPARRPQKAKLLCGSVREARLPGFEWISGKFPNGLWHPPPAPFSENFIAIFSANRLRRH